MCTLTGITAFKLKRNAIMCICMSTPIVHLQSYTVQSLIIHVNCYTVILLFSYSYWRLYLVTPLPVPIFLTNSHAEVTRAGSAVVGHKCQRLASDPVYWCPGYHNRAAREVLPNSNQTKIPACLFRNHTKSKTKEKK